MPIKINSQPPDRRRLANPDARDCRLGVPLVLRNARRHLRAADALADARLWGVATSHLILAVEELAKGWVLTLVAIGIDLPERMIRDSMTTHRSRLAAIFGDLFSIANQHLADRVSARFSDRQDDLSNADLREEWLAEFEREVEALNHRKPRNEPVLALFEWIADAADNKNAGFYVDFTTDGWRHPAELGEDLFEAGREIARSLVSRRAKLITAILDLDEEGQRRVRVEFQPMWDDLAGQPIETVLGKLAVLAIAGPDALTNAEPDEF